MDMDMTNMDENWFQVILMYLFPETLVPAT